MCNVQCCVRKMYVVEVCEKELLSSRGIRIDSVMFDNYGGVIGIDEQR